MAVTFGQLAARILQETNRDSTFEISVENAIITAIKVLEREQYWLFETSTQLILSAGVNNVVLPIGFSEINKLRLLVNTTFKTARNGFVPVTFNDLQDYQVLLNYQGIPNQWAIYNNSIYVSPFPDSDYVLYMDYYYKDPVYPVAYEDTSIWFGDLTQDLTRYYAMYVFYRDTLQAEEKAQYYGMAAQEFINNMRIRNNQRQIINRLSI
jgi:hypothetical protein